MRNLELEIETIQIAIYCDIMMLILNKHKSLSVSKLLVFSYLIRNDNLSYKTIYKANNKKDIILKCLSMLTGKYDEFCNDVEYMIKAIHLLSTNNILYTDKSMIHSEKIYEYEKSNFTESSFIEKVIEASKLMSDEQFMHEVMNNV